MANCISMATTTSPTASNPGICSHHITTIPGTLYTIKPSKRNKSPLYLVSQNQREQERTTALPPRDRCWNLVNSCPGIGNGSNQLCISNCSPKRGLSLYSMSYCWIVNLALAGVISLLANPSQPALSNISTTDALLRCCIRSISENFTTDDVV